ncbi:hypothetical protein SRABI76_00666 [Microbacterium oxydans]|uniref:Uncharacterized protein n=1 Tax=Microbacterium oxydans TaxID=82380 RepID=A0A0F0L465_9MICO|nr:hypothetical protein RS83_03018 [Microbacterium oxydans]CAH0145883.1 hypothetical protein SRABI76_00666 [Microbacterium oxydans]
MGGGEPEPDNRSAHTDDRDDIDEPRRQLQPMNVVNAHFTSSKH